MFKKLTLRNKLILFIILSIVSLGIIINAGLSNRKNDAPKDKINNSTEIKSTNNNK